MYADHGQSVNAEKLGKPGVQSNGRMPPPQKEKLGINLALIPNLLMLHDARLRAVATASQISP